MIPAFNIGVSKDLPFIIEQSMGAHVFTDLHNFNLCALNLDVLNKNPIIFNPVNYEGFRDLNPAVQLGNRSDFKFPDRICRV